MTPQQEVMAHAFALAVIVDQLMDWDALHVTKPGPVSEEWERALAQARASFSMACKRAEFEHSAPAGRA